MLDIMQLNDMLVPELKELAERMELKGYKRLNKQELIFKILDHQATMGDDQDFSKKEEPTAKKEETVEAAPEKQREETAKEDTKAQQNSRLATSYGPSCAEHPSIAHAVLVKSGHVYIVSVQ